MSGALSVRVLVVNGRCAAREQLVGRLRGTGFEVVEAPHGRAGWQRFCGGDEFAAVVSTPPGPRDEFDLLGHIRSRSEVPVIVLSPRPSLEAAVSALKAGADEFVCERSTPADEVAELVRRAVAARSAGAGHDVLEDRLQGRGAAIAGLRERVLGLAPLSTPVLVRGEPGSGRDTVVRALHETGSSAAGGLMRIEAGRFTRALSQEPGGAVYLDGVEQLSAAGQEYWARRLKEPALGPRLFASSSRLLRRATHSAGFHPGLATALDRFEIRVPSLAERHEDFPELAHALVARAGSRLGRTGLRLSQPALGFLQRKRWPRNVAQLEEVLERAVAFTRGREIPRRTVAGLYADSEETLASIRRVHATLEREELLDAIQRSGGNISRTAQRLGRSRSAVYRLIEKYRIPLSQHR